jgi:hypothetical protein
MEFLFREAQYGLRILVTVLLVLALIKFLAWLVRDSGSEQTGAASRQGR